MKIPASHIIETVAKMRQAQRDYLRCRNQRNLRYSIALEREVDALLFEYQHGVVLT